MLLRSLVKCGTGELWCLLVREMGSHQTFLPLLVVGGFGSSLNMSLCLDFLVVFSANFVAICFLLVCSISRFNYKQPLAYSLPVIVATAFLCNLKLHGIAFWLLLPSKPGTLLPNEFSPRFSRMLRESCCQHQAASSF